MTPHWLYLKTVLRHKWFVFWECWRLAPNYSRHKWALRWRGVVHDLSKFRPSEWGPYARYFYGQKDDQAFDLAWLCHQKRNPHHWQWWVLREDDGGTKVMEMPLVYMLEMVCDWRGAGRAYGNADTLGWYEKNRENMRLGPETRAWVEHELGYERKPLIFRKPRALSRESR